MIVDAEKMQKAFVALFSDDIDLMQALYIVYHSAHVDSIEEVHRIAFDTVKRKMPVVLEKLLNSTDPELEVVRLGMDNVASFLLHLLKHVEKTK